MKVVLFLFCLLAFQADAGNDQAYTVERLRAIFRQAFVLFDKNPRSLKQYVKGVLIKKDMFNKQLEAEVYVLENQRRIYSQVLALLSGRIFLIKPV